MKTIKETVEDFFEIPIGNTEDLIQDLADTLGHLFQDYSSFVASCGEKVASFHDVSMFKLITLL